MKARAEEYHQDSLYSFQFSINSSGKSIETMTNAGLAIGFHVFKKPEKMGILGRVMIGKQREFKSGNYFVEPRR